MIKAARRITAAEAAGLVKSGDWVDYGAVLAQPDVFDSALAARGIELRGVKIRACLSTRPRAVLEADPKREHFQWYNWHFGGYDRKKHDAGLCHYIPCNLGEIPDYYRRFIDPPDIVVLKTRDVDANGFFNLSAANLWHRAMDRAVARLIAAEVGDGACPPRTRTRISTPYIKTFIYFFFGKPHSMRFDNEYISPSRRRLPSSQRSGRKIRVRR